MHDLNERKLLLVEIGVFKGSLSLTQHCRLGFVDEADSRHTWAAQGPNTFWRRCHLSNCWVPRQHQGHLDQSICLLLWKKRKLRSKMKQVKVRFLLVLVENKGVDPYIGKDGTFPGDFSETLDPDMALAQVGFLALFLVV